MVSWPPKKNTAFVLYVGLISQADTKLLQANPTLAAGDVKVATDDGAPGNLATLPVVDADFTDRVKVSLSAGEMNGDRVTVIFSDAAGAEWADLLIDIPTSVRQVDDLAFPTVSGRSTDVLATGEVPIDFDTSIGTLAAAQIEASALDGKGDWNIDKTGYALSATGLDAIVSTATGMVEIAKAVWDRVLTGALHNIAESAGRRLRIIQESGSYEAGSVWVDTINGVAGTTDFENGVDILPTNTIADANTIASSIGLSRFQVAPASIITFPGAQTDEVWEGRDWTLALGGQNIDGSFIFGASVSGIAIATGEYEFEECDIGVVTLDNNGHFELCGLEGTFTIGQAGVFTFHQCFTELTGAVTIDFAALGATAVHLLDFHGQVNFKNMAAGDTVHITGAGTISTETCTAGVIDHDGFFEYTDAGGNVTENQSDIKVGVDDLQTRVPTALVGGRMDSDVAVMQANVITAGVIATDAVDADALATDAVQEIARAILPQINTAFSDIEFLFVAASDHVTPVTGATGTGVTRSIDGGAFGAGTGTLAEVGDGIYQYDASAADMNGAIITFRFTASGGTPGAPDDRFLTMITAA